MEDKVTFCKNCGKELVFAIPKREYELFVPRREPAWFHSHTLAAGCDQTFAEPLQTKSVADARRAQHEISGQERLL